jgi:hypothetical protein
MKKIIYVVIIQLLLAHGASAQSSVNSRPATPITVTQTAVHSAVFNGGVSEGNFSLLNYNIANLESFTILGINIWDDDINQSQTIPAITNSIMARGSEDFVYFQEDWSENYHNSYIVSNFNGSVYPYVTEFSTETRSEAAMIADYIGGDEYFLTYKGDGLWRFGKQYMSSPLHWKYSDCEGNDCRSKKGFSLSIQKVGTTVAGEAVYVHIYNTHIQSGRTASKNAIRKTQLNELWTAIESNSVSKGYPVIVIGDWNTGFYRDDAYDDGLNDFVNNVFSNGRQLKDVLYDMKGWSYDLFEDDEAGAEAAGEGIEHCFYMSSDDVELIPIEFNDVREDFGGSRIQNADGTYDTGWSGHPPIRYAFSYATNYVDGCSQYLASYSDFETGTGDWPNESGDDVKTADGYLKLLKDSKAWTDPWDFTNVKSWYVQYEWRTNSNWDSDDYFYIQYSLNGGDNWTTIQTVYGSMGSVVTGVTDTIAEVSPEMVFRVVSNGSRSNEKVWFESMSIYVCGNNEYPVQKYEKLTSALKAASVDEWPLDNDIQSTNSSELFKLFPNPAKDGFRVVLTQEMEGPILIDLFDVNGQKVLSRVVNSNDYISVNGLPQGLYVVKVENNKEVYYRKLVVR